MPFLGGFLRETYIVYPTQIGDWKAQGEHLYDPREYGVSVRYVDTKHDGHWIDLYFYPAGVLSKDEIENAAKGEIESIHAAERANLYRDVHIADFQRFSIEIPDGKDKSESLDARSTGMSYDRSGKIEHSAMTFLFENLYFVKGRLSLPEKDLSVDETRALLESFTSDAMKTVSIMSTGGCWMPMPVEQLVPSQIPDDSEVLATQIKDGKKVTYLLKDRVLAVDPKSESAKAMSYLGMAMTHRLFLGCWPAEDINHEVKENEREIKLVYPPPDKNPSSSQDESSGPNTITG